MEATQIIDVTLSIVINLFSILVIGVFLIELQAAWNNHTPTSTSTFISIPQIEPSTIPVVEPMPIPVQQPVIKPIVKESASVSMSKKSKSKVEVDSLRERCSSRGIEWRFAQTNPQTNRKRHLTVEEMMQALA
jgi:hypothetical protein